MPDKKPKSPAAKAKDGDVKDTAIEESSAPETEGTEADATEAPKDVKDKFREILAQKQKKNAGSGTATGIGGPKNNHTHGPAGSGKNYATRKSG